MTDGIATGMTEHELAPWFETVASKSHRDDINKGVEQVNNRKERFWKTHSTVGLLPKPYSGKIIKHEFNNYDSL